MPNKSVNAWIFLNEDEPQGSTYKTPGSSYQSLIEYGVYNNVDMVNMCFVEVLQTSADTIPPGDGSSYTIRMGAPQHNQPYMEWLIQDARQANPNIKLLVTLVWGTQDMLSQIFSADPSQWQKEAEAFAANLRTYLDHFQLDGFDVDWESPICYGGTQKQFAILFTAVRAAFGTDGRYVLTLSPAEVGNLDAPTVNSAFDFVNLQLYAGISPQEYIDAGIQADLLAYGAKFESGFQTAQEAYEGYQAGGYAVATQWRLNSDNFRFEQAQQMILYQLIQGTAAGPFDDTPIVGAAGSPLISSLVVRSGEVIDSIQVTNTGGPDQSSYQMPRHGGNGGHANDVTIAEGDGIAGISGYVGCWFGWDCVLQLTITTKMGQVFGPFGTMANASSSTPFSYTAPADQTIIAFKGSVVEVPMAGGGSNYIIAGLTPTYG
ncbi:MAG: glycosyl hydrolase family 18 protein [Allosphingosinicella sp.]